MDPSQLLETKGDSLAFLVDRDHLAGDRIALLQHFVSVRNLAGPRHVADVQQAVDAFFQFDERTVVGEVANRTADAGTRWVLGGHFVPRIRLSLLHTQRNLLLVLVDTEHDHIDFIARIDEFGRVIDAFRPGHFADVNQTFDAVFQLDEGTVRHDVDDFPADLRSDRVLAFDVVPGALFLLLQAESDLFFVAIDVQNHDFDFLVDLHHLGWMADTSPAHVGNMQQTVDTAQVNERTEVGDVLDRSLTQLTFCDFGQQVFLHLLALQLDQAATRNEMLRRDSSIFRIRHSMTLSR